MRLVTIKQEMFSSYLADNEILRKSGRPCVLILRLKYHNRYYDFAVPLRSNISPKTPKNQYFALPPRSTTKSNHRHGIHYIKMFPIKKEWLLRYRIDDNIAAIRTKKIIDANERIIVKSCQEYLARYENGDRSPFSTDIDLLISILESK